MAKATKIPPTEQAWDSRELGASADHTQIVARDGVEIDEALDLQLISIRLPKSLIDDLKFIARREGLKYQPLIRRVLLRHADCEMKHIARQLDAEARCAQGLPVIASRQECDDEPLRKIA